MTGSHRLGCRDGHGTVWNLKLEKLESNVMIASRIMDHHGCHGPGGWRGPYRGNLSDTVAASPAPAGRCHSTRSQPRNFGCGTDDIIDASIFSQTPKMVAVEIPKEFGYVIIVNVIGTFFTLFYLGGQVMSARKKYNVQYPIMYATPTIHKVKLMY